MTANRTNPRPENQHGHRFEARFHKRLDSAYRRRILPPLSTLKKFGLKRGMSVADIGAGTGYFLIPAARVVGMESDVYAVDTSKELLRRLESRKLYSNIRVVHSSDGYAFKIKTGAIDYVIASLIIHENNPVRFLKEIRRIMKRGGTLLVIDWRKDALRSGPPLEERLEPQEVKHFCKAAGLNPKRSLNLNSRYYAVVATRA